MVKYTYAICDMTIAIEPSGRHTFKNIMVHAEKDATSATVIRMNEPPLLLQCTPRPVCANQGWMIPPSLRSATNSPPALSSKDRFPFSAPANSLWGSEAPSLQPLVSCMWRRAPKRTIHCCIMVSVIDPLSIYTDHFFCVTQSNDIKTVLLTVPH